MRLIKFCKPEHNLATGSPSIKIGSLFEYHQGGNGVNSIEDRREGKYNFRLKSGLGASFSSDWLFEMSNGNIDISENGPIFRNPAGFNVPGRVGHEAYLVEARPFVDVLGRSRVSGEVSLNYEAQNLYIFCMTFGVDTTKTPFPEYKAAWSLPLSCADEIARGLMQGTFVALNNISASYYPFNDPGAMKRLRIGCFHSRIKYEGRTLTVDDEDAWPKSRLERILLDTPITKSPSYGHEVEYRFVFIPDLDGEIVELPVPHLLIDASFLLKRVKPDVHSP